MHESRRLEETVTTELVRTAARTMTCRFGAPEAEADRRGRVRALLRSSRALAMTLERFAQTAAPHSRGEHSTTDLSAEADAIGQALADWSFAVRSAAATYLDRHVADSSPDQVSSPVIVAPYFAQPPLEA